MMTRARTLLLVLLAAGLALLGALAGSVPTSAEPGGLFVDCGRALFGRPSVLPDPACASSYSPFDTLSIAALGAAAVLLVLASALALRDSRRVRALSR